MSKLMLSLMTMTFVVLFAPAAAAGDDAANKMKMPNMAAAAPGFTDGEVRKVDKERGKLTLKHGAIKNLDMPGMTMVFTVKDKALLDNVQSGDKVKFKAISEGGTLIVTEIQPIR